MNRTTELKKELKELPEDDVVRAELKGRLDREKEILKIINNQITKVEKMTCSEVLKQNMRWNLEEIKQLTNSEEIEK